MVTTSCLECEQFYLEIYDNNYDYDFLSNKSLHYYANESIIYDDNMGTNETLDDFFKLMFNNTTSSYGHNSTNMSRFCDGLYNDGKCDWNLQNNSHMKVNYTDILPQIILSFIAILLNVTEIYKMKKRKKYFPSEYLMISLSVADFLFSFLVLVALIVSIT